MLRNIWKVRELLFSLVRRDLIVRYQSSVLGFFWSFAKPLALVVIFFVAFGLIFNIPRPNETVPIALHMLVGVLVWTFLARSISEGHWAILSHANLIKKIKLPVEVFPAVTVVGNLINFLLGMLVVYPIILIAMSRSHGGISIPEILLQILILLALTLLTAFLSFTLTLISSALNVFYRDIESLSDVVLQAWFYATPIVYAVTIFYQKNLFGQDARIPRWLETLYWLNPMTPITIAFRRVLLYRTTPASGGQMFGGLEAPDSLLLMYLGISVVGTGILYWIAQAIFRHYARSFADEV